MRRKQSQDMKKYQKKQMRHYLKNIRFRMNRKRRWIFYGLVAAAFVYLAGVWQLRDRIFMNGRNPEKMELITVGRHFWNRKCRKETRWQQEFAVLKCEATANSGTGHVCVYGNVA